MKRTILEAMMPLVILIIAAGSPIACAPGADDGSAAAPPADDTADDDDDCPDGEDCDTVVDDTEDDDIVCRPGANNTLYDLDVTWRGFTGFEGKEMRIGLINLQYASLVGGIQILVLDATGEKNLRFTSAIKECGRYRLDYFVDVDDDTLCFDGLGSDFAWSTFTDASTGATDLDVVMGDVDLEIQFSDQYDEDACQIFNLGTEL